MLVKIIPPNAEEGVFDAREFFIYKPAASDVTSSLERWSPQSKLTAFEILNPDYNSLLIYWWGYCNLSILKDTFDIFLSDFKIGGVRPLADTTFSLSFLVVARIYHSLYKSRLQFTPYPGLQIFSQSAEFSHFGTDFDHFLDQCYCVNPLRKKIGRGG